MSRPRGRDARRGRPGGGAARVRARTGSGPSAETSPGCGGRGGRSTGLARDRIADNVISNRVKHDADVPSDGGWMGSKIAVVGGGSTYTPELVEGFVRRADRIAID